MQRTPRFSILPGMGTRLLRPLLVGVLAAALALPAVADGSRRLRVDDGTLSVRDGVGVVHIAARGTIIGRVDQGQVQVFDRNPFDANDPVVRGGRLLKRALRNQVRRGRNIRFRLVGGFYRLMVRGRGIDLSAVGRGSVTLNGDERYADTGIYSLNGDEFAPLPYERTSLQLAAALPE